MKELKDETIIVTGASGAVGSVVSQKLLAAGYRVGLIDRQQKKLNQVVGNLTEFKDQYITITADLANHESAQEAITTIQQEFNRIDFLFNAMGGWLGGKKLDEHTPDELDKMLAMDLKPTFNLMSAVLPIMKTQQSGKIINFISMAVLGHGAYTAVYTASKAGVAALSKAAAEEYKKDGILIYMFAPSIIDTPANRQGMPQTDFSKWVTIDEIAETAIFVFQAAKSLSSTIFQFTGK